MLSRVYSFLDWDGWSGERVVLRPDSTVPVARAVADHALSLPARLFYVQGIFRFSTTGADSETWQCGLEYVGAHELLADLEVAAIGFEVLDAVAPGSACHLSHAGFAGGVIQLLEAAGVVVPPEIADLVTAGGLAALRDVSRPVAAAATIVDLAATPSDDVALLANIAAVAGESAPAIRAAAEDCTVMANALREAGRRVALHVGMSTDFGYYTGPVFEFRSGAHLWGRGGRYSLAPSLGGHSATGLGLDATALATAIQREDEGPAVVAVVPAQAADLGRAIEVARTLHRNDIPAALQSDGGSTPVAVLVAGGLLQARTPEGAVPLASLDDLLPLLLQFK
jgi:histidyl-tRNA synthetase